MDAPYDHPPPSKALWKGKSLDIIRRRTEDKELDFTLAIFMLRVR
jgi:hypothetical protein